MILEGAIVMRSTGSWYLIRTKDGEEVEARIKGKFRIQGIKTTNPVAVGDLVDFTLEMDNTGVITKIHPRKNQVHLPRSGPQRMGSIKYKYDAGYTD